jgi:hypothetical protein
LIALAIDPINLKSFHIKIWNNGEIKYINARDGAQDCEKLVHPFKTPFNPFMVVEAHQLFWLQLWGSMLLRFQLLHSRSERLASRTSKPFLDYPVDRWVKM